MATKIEPFYQALGSKIQAAREGRRMTQHQLGQSLTPKATRASVANIEHGKQRVLLHTFVQLTDILKVDMRALLPASEPAASGPTSKDVERELRRKLKLAAPALKTLTSVAGPVRTSSRVKI